MKPHILIVIFLPVCFLLRGEAILSKELWHSQPWRSQPSQPSRPVEKRREIRRLPGSLDQIPVFNSNSPEVVLKNGILLSTFPSTKKPSGEPDSTTVSPTSTSKSESPGGRPIIAPESPERIGPPGKQEETSTAQDANLDYSFRGRFDVFAHHIADGKKSGHMENLYLGLLVGNLEDEPAELETLQAESYVSRPDAPFIHLPPLADNDKGKVFAGPGDRVSTELLKGMPLCRGWPYKFKIPPKTTRLLISLPLHVRSLDFPLNGRTILAKLESNRPVRLALVAHFAIRSPDGDFRPPTEQDFITTLEQGVLVEPRETPPTAPDDKGPIRYGRVSGVTLGSTWEAELVDPGLEYMKVPDSQCPVSYPISSVSQGTFGTAQIESAPLVVRYKDCAYEGHGNYGVLYKLKLPIKNESREKKTVCLSLETPVKTDKAQDRVTFFEPPQPQVFFRGSVKTSLARLRTPGLRTQGLAVATSSILNLLSLNILRKRSHMVHIVEHRGESGPPFNYFDLSPGAKRTISVEFYYPADCTPPQLLTVSSRSAIQSDK